MKPLLLRAGAVRGLPDLFDLMTAVLLTMIVSSMSMPVHAQAFTVIAKTREPTKDFDRIHYVVQNGSDPLNRFGVERIVSKNPIARLLARPLILEPPLNSGAKFYTLGNAADGSDFERSIAANLARGGLDLFIYTPREFYLAPNQCANQADCAAAANWGLTAFVDDLAFIRELAAKAHPLSKPFIGGHSLGGMAALAAANELPDAYAGMILSDSTLWITDPGMRAGYDTLCQGLNGAIAAGQVIDNQFAPGVQLIVQLAETAPNDTSPLPIFPADTTNREGYLLFLTLPQPGPPTSIFPSGMVLAAGSVNEDSLYFTSETRWNTLVKAFNGYLDNATLRDVICTFAGDNAFVANLAQYQKPILVFKSGLGFGDLVDDSIALTGSTDVTIETQPEYGHIDLVASPKHKQLFEKKILDWVRTHGIF